MDLENLPRIIPPNSPVESAINKKLAAPSEKEARIALLRVYHACAAAGAALKMLGEGLADYLHDVHDAQYAWWMGLEAEHAANGLEIAAMEIRKSREVIKKLASEKRG